METQVNQYFDYVAFIVVKDGNSISLVDYMDNLKSDKKNVEAAKQL